MSKFRLEFETDNDQFRPGPPEGTCILLPGSNPDDCSMHDHELNTTAIDLILTKVGHRIGNGGPLEGSVMDDNGNTIGRYRFEDS